MSDFLENFHRQMSSIAQAHEVPWVLKEYSHLNADPLQTKLQEVFERRSRGEPLAYIFGHWSFLDFELDVGPGVLIPRPETEELVERALKEFEQHKNFYQDLRIVDAGAGSGCLGLGFVSEVLKKYPNLKPKLYFIEQSTEAIVYLQKNTETLCARYPNLHCEIFQGSWKKWAPPGGVEVLLSNPPYIAPNDPGVEESVKQFEPAMALYPSDIVQYPDASGPYRDLLRLAQHSLVSCGVVALEMGHLQPQWIQNYSKENFPELAVRVEQDMAHKDRFFLGYKRSR